MVVFAPKDGYFFRQSKLKDAADRLAGQITTGYDP
jgi:hypothetical protein